MMPNVNHIQPGLMLNSIDLVVPWNRGSDMYDRKQSKREVREWIRSFISWECLYEPNMSLDNLKVAIKFSNLIIYK